MTTKKTGSLAINWCFTLNNYTDEEYEDLKKMEHNYIIIGKEVGEDKKTPHLQGYVQLVKKKRITGLKKINSRAHWEVAYGSPEENKKYCSKDGNFYEDGTMNVQGKKKVDMVAAVHQVLEGRPTKDLLDEHGAGYIMHRAKIEEVAAKIKQELDREKRKQLAKDIKLRDWQVKAVEKLMSQDNRKILWVIDPKGNNGKTFLAGYLADMHGARIFENGRSADIKYMWNGEQLVVFDLVRSCQDHINYEVIEQIKNGRFNSTKYECKEKVVEPGKHVKMIVFTNEEPDRSKLSEDRWDIIKLMELKTADDTKSPRKKRQRTNSIEDPKNPIYWDVDKDYDLHNPNESQTLGTQDSQMPFTQDEDSCDDPYRGGSETLLII